MLIFLTIFQYLLQTISDVLDKFLISKRKIEPVNYTFYTVVTGALLLLAWPWFYHSVSAGSVWLSLFSGAWFSLAMYVFYLALAQGEVSRVVPFVYGLVPLFDIILQGLFGLGRLTTVQAAAMWLLIPGALLIGYHKGSILTKHFGLNILAALLLSGYFLLWHAASVNQPVLNNLMWNRIGAAVVL